MAKWWTKKRIKVVVLSGAVTAAVLVTGVIAWYSFPARAHSKELSLAQNMMSVTYSDVGSAIVLKPATKATKGIVLYPASRVDPAAYAYKMSAIALKGIEVIIARAPLNVAQLDMRDTSTLTKLAPTVEEWYVAGHSLGATKACQLAHNANNQFKGLILLGAYCPEDIADAHIPVLSISGTNDRLTRPEDLEKSKPLLPASTKYETIQGLNHSGFGDYSKQDGDGDATITTAQARNKIATLITNFIGTPVPPQR